MKNDSGNLQCHGGYILNNVYNEDEYGLLHRMGPNRTYPGSNEHRCNVCGTSFQKYRKDWRLYFVLMRMDLTYFLFCTLDLLLLLYASKTTAIWKARIHRKIWVDGCSRIVVFWSEKKKSDGPWLILLTIVEAVSLELRFLDFWSNFCLPIRLISISRWIKAWFHKRKFGIAVCFCVMFAITWKRNGPESMDSKRTLKKADGD